MKFDYVMVPVNIWVINTFSFFKIIPVVLELNITARLFAKVQELILTDIAENNPPPVFPVFPLYKSPKHSTKDVMIYIPPPCPPLMLFIFVIKYFTLQNCTPGHFFQKSTASITPGSIIIASDINENGSGTT